MQFRKVVYGLLIFLPIGGYGNPAAAACYSPSEYRASRVRELQTELMVAALSCKGHPELDLPGKYNQFVRKFGPDLQANATVLRSHFARHYGKRQDKEFDAYITALANEVSGRALGIHDYCRVVAPTFDRALAVESRQLEGFAATSTGGSRLAKACSS